MELKEFVSESLKQIIDGVVDAQIYAKSKGASINPKGMTYINTSVNGLIVPQDRGIPDKPVQIMEFDVAITVTQTSEAKAGLAVFAGALGLSTQGKIEDGNTNANRIKFSVPFLFPEQQ